MATIISDVNLTRLKFYGSAGLPDPLSATADTVAPFVIACS
jgi:hypothetical protein